MLSLYTFAGYCQQYSVVVNVLLIMSTDDDEFNRPTFSTLIYGSDIKIAQSTNIFAPDALCS